MNPPKHSNNSSILIDKFNGRRSTPDSEALASSDDEIDRPDHPQPPSQPQKPTRRASWLNDTTQAAATQPRKGSFASSSMSPTTSHPTMPSAESSNWGTHGQSGVGRAHTGSGSFPWPSGIWTSESRKEPPSRLTEVLPSPTSIQSPSSSAPYFSDASTSQKAPSSGPYFSESSTTHKDPSSNPTIPFAIPLHPTPKT